MCVLHKCDNRECCNPSHYFLGTLEDNVADMKFKGRAARGQEVNGKISESEVREIRKLRALGESLSSIAKIYNVTHTAIRYIVIRKSWKHVL